MSDQNILDILRSNYRKKLRSNKNELLAPILSGSSTSSIPAKSPRIEEIESENDNIQVYKLIINLKNF